MSNYTHPFIFNRYKVPTLLGVKLGFKIRELTGIPKVYSEPSNREKVIFIHIPKAAGSSVGKALYGTDIIGHYPYYVYKKYDANKFDNYYKFCVVRNPFTRIESAYNYLLSGGKGRADKELGDYIRSKSTSFDDFCQNLLTPSFTKKHVHFTPQVDFVYEGDVLVVNKVIKLENISKDIKIVEDYLGRELRVGKENSIQKNDVVLSELSRNKIRDLYENDFIKFGYE